MDREGGGGRGGTKITMKKVFTVIGGIAALSFPAIARAQTPAHCDDLTGFQVDSGVVEIATHVSAGQEITITDTNNKIPAPVAFCRVLVRLKPTKSSDIRAEFWLPDQPAWNGKFIGLGSGGFGGGLENSAMLGPIVQKGYAGGATDMGHRGSPISAKWAGGQPEKIVDWGRRANHLTAVAGKQLVRAYYGETPRQAYFSGCSDGGREAVMEGWRYPEDYDGIIAGAPAADFTSIAAQFVWNARIAARANLTLPKLLLVSKAVLAKCDGLDGVKDGVLENPTACHFDPATLECKSGDGPDCLTAAQVAAVEAIRRGPRTRNGVQISHGFLLDDNVAALGWNAWITSATAVERTMGTDFYRWMVYDDPNSNSDRFDLDRDWVAGRNRLAALIDSDHPDLRAFVRRGGKLMLYHGWSDPALPPENTVRLYDEIRHQLGRAGAESVRLFMVPGMSHCALGAGPSVFDTMSTMDKWVETGRPPEKMIAISLPPDAMAAVIGGAGKPATAAAKTQTAKLPSRPLCAWPKVAAWDGKGSTDDAVNFSCRLPRKLPSP